MLWGGPVLLLGLLVVDLELERDYQDKHQTGWVSVDPPAMPPGCEYVSFSDIGISRDGRLWVVDRCNGLSIYDGETWQSYLPSVDGIHVTSGALDEWGRIWLLAFEGVYLLDGGQWTGFNSDNSPLPEPYPANLLSSIAFDGSGRAWVGAAGPDPSKSAGLLVFDGKAWSHYTTRNSGLGHDYICGIVLDTQDRAWISTWDGGLSIFDGSRWTSYADRGSDTPNLCLDDGSVAIDQKGRVWVGGTGLSVFDGNSWTSYRNENVYIFDGAAGEWLSYPREAYRGRTEDIVREIAIDSQGRVWISAYPGLSAFDGTHWTTYTNVSFGLPPSSEISSIAIDVNGVVWFSTYTPGSNLISFDPRLAALPSRSTVLLRNLLWSPHIRWIPLSLLALLWLGALQNAPLGVPVGLLILSFVWASSNRGWAGGGVENFFRLFLPPVLPTFGALIAAILFRLAQVARDRTDGGPARRTAAPAIVGGVLGLLMFAVLSFFGCIMGC